MTDWTFQDKPFEITEEIKNSSVKGFVYLITNKITDRKYIGLKTLFKEVKLPPLKGKTRKRKVIKETDWKKYYGSSEWLKKDIEEFGKENFKREILHFGNSKSELNYLEIKEQIEREVLLTDEYYNNIVNVRINGNHLKGFRND